MSVVLEVATIVTHKQHVQTPRAALHALATLATVEMVLAATVSMSKDNPHTVF